MTRTVEIFSKLTGLALVLAFSMPLDIAVAAKAKHSEATQTKKLDDDNSAITLPKDARLGNYVGHGVMMPMRDGVLLHAQVWRPVNDERALPILLTRGPYGFPMERTGASFDTAFRELAEEGYIFVLADIRGRFGSEGRFVMLRSGSNGPGSIDESTDAYDTVDWLTESLPDNNGKVGVFGVSYGGWTTGMAVVNSHPAIKAVSMQASPEDMFIGDDFFHNGAFRLDYSWEYSAALETDGRTLKPFDFGVDDTYSWFLKQGELAKLDLASVGKTLPTWQNFIQHPNYDSFWRDAVTSSHMPKTVIVPNLIVAGWWDQEDFYGPQKIYERQEKGDIYNRNFLVVGPWNHGGWNRKEGSSYGPINLGSDTATYFRKQVQARWFRHWLKGEGKLDQPEALVFQTGSNAWKSYRSWPPTDGVSLQSLYLHSDGKLSFNVPLRSDDAKPDSFISDPANPVPYREQPIQPVLARNSSWPNWLSDDQAPFAHREDVLSWQTEPLVHDVAIVGKIKARIFASTTGSDADWVVKLIDIYPANESIPEPMRGRQLIVASDILRGRFREGFETPKPIPSGKVLPYNIDLHSASHVFRKGHRIAVQIQSSWFPLIDRNPQIFVQNIFNAKPDDFKAQKHSVYHDTRYPSAITVSVETMPE